jgi:hypothetical protein
VLNPLTLVVPGVLLRSAVELQLSVVMRNARVAPPQLHGFLSQVAEGHRHMLALAQREQLPIALGVDTELHHVQPATRDTFNHLYIPREQLLAMLGDVAPPRWWQFWKLRAINTGSPEAERLRVWVREYPFESVYCAIQIVEDNYIYAAHPDEVDVPDHDEPEYTH